MPDEIQQEINDVSNSDSIYLNRESCSDNATTTTTTIAAKPWNWCRNIVDMLLGSSGGASPSASARDNVVILNKEMFNLIKTKLRLHSSHAIFDIFRLSITSVVCSKCFAIAWAKQFNRVIFSIEHVRNMFKHEKNSETWKDMTPWLHFIWLW